MSIGKAGSKPRDYLREARVIDKHAVKASRDDLVVELEKMKDLQRLEPAPLEV